MKKHKLNGNLILDIFWQVPQLPQKILLTTKNGQKTIQKHSFHSFSKVKSNNLTHSIALNQTYSHPKGNFPLWDRINFTNQETPALTFLNSNSLPSRGSIVNSFWHFLRLTVHV